MNVGILSSFGRCYLTRSASDRGWKDRLVHGECGWCPYPGRQHPWETRCLSLRSNERPSKVMLQGVASTSSGSGCTASTEPSPTGERQSARCFTASARARVARACEAGLTATTEDTTPRVRTPSSCPDTIPHGHCSPAGANVLPTSMRATSGVRAMFVAARMAKPVGSSGRAFRRPPRTRAA
jgi:hypothetical protein